MARPTTPVFNVIPAYRPIFAQIDLTPQTLFDHPRIKVWRSIPERENCTLDVVTDEGREVRLHVKRYHPTRGSITPAEEEARGISALQNQNIPTAPLVAWGTSHDRRCFLITEDLKGYRAGDKALAGGLSFEDVLIPTADLAAQLHNANLHHRDLYLCHFFIKGEAGQIDLKLIDAARVKTLPTFLTRRRWIVKDLAQFWYSTYEHSVTPDQRRRWLERYQTQRKDRPMSHLLRLIESKAHQIAAHDKKLRLSQPRRNISLPQADA